MDEKTRSIKPQPWTPERVERWEQNVPAKVMLWTSAQCGAFLDFTEGSEERLYPQCH